MNPYHNLHVESFWRTAIAEHDALEIRNIWKPKFRVSPDLPIATAGSCFAQHISKALVARGYPWLDGEPAPKGLSAASQQLFNYGVFSFRTGNIYTAAALRQWLEWALMGKAAPDEVWLKDGRFYDPFRPAIEPNGFHSYAEMLASRQDTFNAIRTVLGQSQCFVFTLGLTEAWLNIEQNHVYPLCPGTAAGAYAADLHQFVNYSYAPIYQDLDAAFKLMKALNPTLKFLLTVSPVPLTATASDHHVLVATAYSKATLRAVAGDLAAARDDTDYFPAYELITGSPFRSRFFQDNLRSVTPEGVDFVMAAFFSGIGGLSQKFEPKIVNNEAVDLLDSEADLVCEEELLAAFMPEKARS